MSEPTATTPEPRHTELGLGKIITNPNQGRDAVHVAVIPLVATCEMQPGERLKNGIVDPFLKESVKPGERYWLWVTPNTVTALRHSWSHPAFDDEELP